MIGDVYKRQGHDSLTIEYGLHAIGAALGSVLSDPEDDATAIIQHVAKDLDDLSCLDLEKVRRKNHPWFQMNYDACQIALEKVGDEVAVGVTIPGPITAAASICQTDVLLRGMIKKKEQVHQLIRFCTDAIKQVFGEFMELPIGFSLCDPIASSTILRPSQYDEFCLPYTQEIFDFLHERNNGACYHVCGDTTAITKNLVDTGCDTLSLDNKVDLEFAKKEVGDRITIIGNLDANEYVYLGNRESIFAGVKECFRKCWDNPCGYIFATGCDIPKEAPLENLDAMMDAARYYGKWPLKAENFE